MGIIIFVWACHALNYMYVTYDAWHRILFRSYYSQDNIDNVFMGTSHVYCDINPVILDEINGQSNFNLATPGQRWDNTYYLLKDAIENYDIDNAYLECYYRAAVEYTTWIDKSKEYQIVDWMDAPENYSRPWLITYEMKPSHNSFAMLKESSDDDYMIETIFPFARYRSNIFNWNQVKRNIDVKNSEEFQDYTYHEDVKDGDGRYGFIEYYEKGCCYSENLELLDQEKRYLADRDLNEYGIGDRSRKYMRKTIEMCQNNGINVKLFIAPIYDLQLISVNDYDSYIAELSSIADEYGVELYDFNLIKNEYLDIKNGAMFRDIGHLNGRGAELYTPVLWDVLSSSREDNNIKFFDTYEEKLLSEEAEIYGLYYKDINPGDDINANGSPVYVDRQYYIASNRQDIKYRVTKTIIDGDDNIDGCSEVIQEYDENDSFVLPVDEHGIIMIEGQCDGQDLKLSVKY